MSLITHKGVPRFEPGIDLILRYAAEKRTKVASVELWGFERLPYGRIVVRWKNGAIGTYTGPTLSDLMDVARSQGGWPPPVHYHHSLPYHSGMLYVDDFPKEEVAESEDKGEGEVDDIQRVVRRRSSGDTHVGRQRRVRAEG